jgi:hypothetical protein
MKTATRLLAILAATAGTFALASPAMAQATRTWVSGVGDDANPCSRTAPCKTFAGAISKTATTGEISCLDPGGFGAVTITKSISIVCDYTEGGVLNAGTTGILVNVPSTSTVVLSGLDIDGAGTGINGIRMIQAGTLHIRNSKIRNGTTFGVSLQTTGATNNFGTVSGGGIQVQPTGGPNVNVTMDRVHVARNFTGINIDGASGATVRVQVNNSTLAGNSSGSGLTATTGIQPTRVILKNSTVSGNGTGVTSNGSGASVLLDGNAITGNTTGLNATGGGTISTNQTNNITDNTSAGSVPTVVARN